jgi:predicted O-linked N-acetylglucosamine transferase (SPINDLY family)
VTPGTAQAPLRDARTALNHRNLAATARLCRQFLEQSPLIDQTLMVLGMALSVANDQAAAIPVLRLALALRPNDPATMNALAIALREEGGLDEARQLAEQVVARVPGQPEYLRNLATILMLQDRPAEAEVLFARLMPARQQKDYLNRIKILFDLGHSNRAWQVARAAACLWPGDAETWHRLGIIADIECKPVPSLAFCRRAVVLNPGHDDALVNLADRYLAQGNPAMSIRLCRDLLARRGDSRPEAYANLGRALARIGQAEAAVAAFDRTEALRPDPATGSNAAYFRSYLDEVDNRGLFAAHQAWNRRYAAGLAAAAPHANAAEPGRRLRIGYVSPDFVGHSCAFFLLPLYQHHDPRQVEVFSYANLEREDGVTEQFRRAGHAWRDISRLSDDEAAALVRRDGIDILVDLAGHTARNRLLLFARKPAPVQVTWLGYPTTTGLQAIDWRISDRWLTPADTTEGFAEGLWRLERISHCYRPPEISPPVGPLPAKRNGVITFGSANNFAKISDACLRLWAGALSAVPGARLRLKSRNLDSAEARDTLSARFAAAGGDPARLDLASGNEKTNDHLDQYNQVDIALDTTPYGGMTTTCEALWMGVPVITLAGDRTAARYATAVLAALGLDELVAETPHQFAVLAARWAGDLPALAALRAGLRQRLDASPLRDEAGFARAMEDAYRTMWSRWCRQ